MPNIKNDIIAAIGTPYGRGAVSCIRISGAGSAQLVTKMTEGYGEVEHGQMKPCRFVGRVRDKIMAVIYLNGKSYTGEESAELYFHGGKLLTEQALYSIIDAGARLAEAGEFTRRAFLNGKIDLTQAEGIGALIDGESPAALASAYEQSEGRTREAIDTIYHTLTAVAAAAEVCIDYPEEDLEEKTREELDVDIHGVLDDIEAELVGYDGGRIKREGARIVLTGKTNVGKSTLFNTLLREERAIVSDEAGTTRDTIEEKFVYKGIGMVLVDTAGIRETESKAEQLGIERSRNSAKSADVVLHVLRGDTYDDTVSSPDNTITVVNVFSGASCAATASEHVMILDAKSGAGVEKLKEAIYARVKEKADGGGHIDTARQYEALREAKECLLRALTANRTLTMDCVCSDLCNALQAVGRITGKTASESVIDEIFSRFCVGK